jgi:maltokinase
MAGAADGDTDTGAGATAGSFIEDAFQLGAATAQVHQSLADRLTTGVLTESGAAGVADRVVNSYRGRVPIAPGLEKYEDTVLKLADRFRKNCWNLPTQRIHNDLHLTQVLKTRRTWILIDFEGEPNTPITRRNEFGSPLRDVACMLRSFDYAAYFMRYSTPGGANRQEPVDRWLTAVRSAFVDGYRNAGGATSGGYLDALLLFELEKALFEIDYEYNNRPTWLHVATESTYRLLSA